MRKLSLLFSIIFLALAVMPNVINAYTLEYVPNKQGIGQSKFIKVTFVTSDTGQGVINFNVNDTFNSPAECKFLMDKSPDKRFVYRIYFSSTSDKEIMAGAEGSVVGARVIISPNAKDVQWIGFATECGPARIHYVVTGS